MNEILLNLEKINDLLANNEAITIEEFTKITLLTAKIENKVVRLCEVMDWVAVNDELPDNHVTVLVAFKNEGMSSLRTGYWCGNSWIVNGGKPILTEEIVYWKKLPQPPCA